MYLTKEEFNIIEKALLLLPQGEEFDKLNKKLQDVILDADCVMISLLKKKEKSNERIAKYIANKRKTNKNYAR